MTERSVKISYDNFESIIVAWLHAVGTFKDSDNPELLDWEYDDYDNSVYLKFNLDQQMSLPFGDPLGR